MDKGNDGKYVELLKNGDYHAFDTLFKKYAEKLYAFAFSITKSAYIAEEITQTVFLKVWDKRELLDGHFSFKSYLFSIVYNETVSYLRKEKSEKAKIGHITSTFNQESNETELKIEFNNLKNIAKQEIDKLPEKRKEIFVLSREQGFSNKEIANKLNISVKTVENQITKALKVLREQLGKYDILGLLFYFLFLYK